MHILHTQHTLRLRAFAFLAAIMVGGWDCMTHAQQISNGIFNGNFEDGIVGWSKLGPGYDKVVLDSERHATANRVDAEFFIRSPRTNNKHFTVYSASVTGVVSGQSYPMRLRAKGNGEIVFGVMEFDENNEHLGNRYSDVVQLSEKYADSRFVYKPSAAAKKVRPAVAVLERQPDSASLVIVVNSFQLDISDRDFADATKEWPQAFNAALRNHQGLTENEQSEIRAIEEHKSIVPPFRAIANLGEGRFRLTAADLKFGQQPLPTGISPLGREILAAPVSLLFRINGKDESIVWKTPELRFAPAEVHLISEAVLGELKLKLEGRLEYDAMHFVTLSMESSAPVNLEHLALKLSLKAEAAKYIRYALSTGGDGKLYESGYGPIPAFGEHVTTNHCTGLERKPNHWKPNSPVRPGDVVFDWKLGRFDMLMLCDEERGLGFVCESAKGWSFTPGDTQFQIQRHEHAVEATIHFVTKPVTIRGKRVIEFALQAMPPKPTDRTFAKLHFNTFWTGSGEVNEGVIQTIQTNLAKPPAKLAEVPPAAQLYADGYAWYRGNSTRPLARDFDVLPPPDIGFVWWNYWSTGCGGGSVANPKALRRYVGLGRAVNHLGLPYFASTHLSPADPNAYFYAIKNDDWGIRPRIPSSYTLKIDVDSRASAYQAWCIGRMMDDYDIPGVYFDNCSPELNTSRGAGYTDDDGNQQPKLGIFGIRNLFRMTRQEFAKRGRKPLILFHAGLYPGICSFADVQLEGEGTYGLDHTELITPGEFRARWTNPNATGLVMVYLPQFGYGIDRKLISVLDQEKQGTRPLLAQTLIHGTQIFGEYMDRDPLYRSWAIFNGLKGDTVDFLPYWKLKLSENFTKERLFFSFYASGSKVVLAAANHGIEEKSISLPLSLFPAAFQSSGRVSDDMDGKAVVLTGGELKFVIPPKDFRLLTLEP